MVGLADKAVTEIGVRGARDAPERRRWARGEVGARYSVVAGNLRGA